MPSLENIKNRISSVDTFRKITKAMELVSVSKLRKSQENLFKIKEYADHVKNVFLNINSQIKSWSEVFPIDKEKPRIFILITSDMGLCGGYNSNILKLAKKQINNDDYIIVLGNKGIKFCNENFDKRKIILEYNDFGEKPNYKMNSEITDTLISYLLISKIRSIHLFYTRYINQLQNQVEDLKIFPFSRSKNLEYLKDCNNVTKMEFDPSPEVVLRNSISIYINAILLEKIAQSKISEIASRRMAMENSTDNANEIIDKLKKDYNKIRQSKITQEITEIVSGADNE